MEDIVPLAHLPGEEEGEGRWDLVGREAVDQVAEQAQILVAYSPLRPAVLAEDGLK